MVEDDHPVIKRERKIGEPPIVGRRGRQVLGVSHGVVRGIADRAPGKPRQSLEMHCAIALDQLLEIAKRIGRREAASLVRIVGIRDRHIVAPRLESQEWLGAQKAEPSHLLAANHALEEKRWR